MRSRYSVEANEIGELDIISRHPIREGVGEVLTNEAH